MSYDFFANLQDQLSELMNTVIQSQKNYEAAKNRRDKQTQKNEEDKIRQAAKQIVQTKDPKDQAPHLARLWLKATGLADDNHIQTAWQQRLTMNSAGQEVMRKLGLSPEILPLIDHLPRLSFAITLPFQLASPYMSRDETAFYIIENPVRKEWVFKVPYVSPSSWKGALRAALWQLGYTEDHQQIKSLFGAIRDSKDDEQSPGEDFEGQAGCVHLSPTFFDDLGLEVINPHDRKTGVGKRGPIYFECVPAKREGRLTMLYVPVNVPARATEVTEDLKVLAAGVVAMLTMYGFGAKTSSGYGTAEDALAGEGHLVVHHPERPVIMVEPPVPDNVQRFRVEYPNEEFTMKPKEWRKKNQATSGDQNKYKVAREAFTQYQEQVKTYQQQKSNYEATLAAPPPPIQRSFSSLQELGPVAQEIVSEILGSPEDK